MSNQNISLQHVGTGLDRAGSEPLYRQVADRIAALVLDGTLARGCKLPASRELARSIGVSRNTIVVAYEQLIERGMLRTGAGSGTYVEDTGGKTVRPRDPEAVHRVNVEPAGRGKASAVSSADHGTPFRINHPAIDAFPIREWTRNTSRNLRRLANNPTRLLSSEGSPAGYPPLREAIAAHMKLARGVDCTAANILVFGGADQALDVILRVIAKRTDAVWCEDPSHRGCVEALSPHCGDVVPVPVDADGIDVERAIALRADAKAAYVFPSNHIPLGVQLSLPRRHALLDWAAQRDAWVIECDYDSELRYSGQPLPSIKSLDRRERVIHLGTFSKIMYPTLRIGYAVLPDELIAPCVEARSATGRYPLLDQMLVADFVQSGALARHVRRMRNIYAKRQAVLLRSLERHLAERVRANPVQTGMQLLALLPGVADDRRVAAGCAEQGLEVAALSEFTIAEPRPPSVVLGFAGFSEDEIEDGVKKLKLVLDAVAAR
jgi:GntR family transcriptional regulator/MocR family aminotransferase